MRLITYTLIVLLSVSCSQNPGEYEGEYSNNMKHGWGKLTTPSGIYFGQFENDSISGIGKYQGNDGGYFIGQWKDQKWNGIGEASWVEGRWAGDTCIGEFENHEINGFVEYKFKDGTYHLGFYKNGKQHGIGIRKWKNNKWDGDYYIGEWRDGQINGFGKYFDKSSGIIKQGDFSPNGSVIEKAFSVEDSTEIMIQLTQKLKEIEEKLNTTKTKMHSQPT